MIKTHQQTFKTLLILGVLWLVPALWAQAAESITKESIRCKGHGLVSFKGSGTLEINGDGILIVNENAERTFSYGPSDRDTPDFVRIPQCLLTDDGNCVYIGLDTHTSITGDDIAVTFVGANIGLTAAGNGQLDLKGYGIFLSIQNFGTWGIEGTTIVLSE